MVTNGSLPPNEKPQVDTTKLIAWGFSNKEVASKTTSLEAESTTS